MSVADKITSPSDEHPDPVLVAIEQAMIRIRRRQSRGALGRSAVANLPQPVDLRQITVVDAVEQGVTEPAEGVTVGLVAERLGIDPSRASRLVSAAIQNGYIRRVASQQDGRRTCLELTDHGQEVVHNTHHVRHALYNQLLSGWSPRDRREFARLLTKFTDALAEAESAVPQQAQLPATRSTRRQ